MALEYRICWNASSNITFHGCDDWQPADEDTVDEVEDALGAAPGGLSLPPGLEMALEGSGFEWFVETREVDGDA